MKKKIATLERMLINECRKETPSFVHINRLFDLGADPNAVNEYGESVLFEVLNGLCGETDTVRGAEYAPQIVVTFLCNGFDVRRHGLNTVSAIENSIYDKNMRLAAKIILERRRKLFKEDLSTLKVCAKAIYRKVMA